MAAFGHQRTLGYDVLSLAMMLDHIGFAVGDFEKSRKFYLKALAPLGIQVVMEGEEWAMLGEGGKGQFWFGAYGEKPGPIHVAFAAESRAQVRAFYEAALRCRAKITCAIERSSR